MDKLQECAKAFENLLDKQYYMVVGRKGKAIHIRLSFDAIDFHHLVGLHKLKDLHIARQNRENVFKEVLAGNITYSFVEKSSYFSPIENRILPFINLEKILDDNRLVFKYNQNQNPASSIPAEFLLSTPFQTNDIYIFLDRKDPNDLFFCRSFFPKENKDYTIGQPTYTLLFKEKISLSTGTREVQYDRLSRNPNPV